MKIKNSLFTQGVFFYFRALRLPLLLTVVFVIQNFLFISLLKIAPHVYMRCILVTFSLGLVLYGISLFFGRPARYWYLLAVSCVISLIFLSEFIYYLYSGGLLQASALEYSKQAFALRGTVSALFTPKLFLFTIQIFIIVGALLLMYLRPRCQTILSWKEQCIIVVGMFVCFFGAYGYLLVIEKREWGNIERLTNKMYDVDSFVSKVGIVNYFLYDGIKRALRGNAITSEDEAFLSQWSIKKNDTNERSKEFGIAKGRNVLFVMVESLDQYVIQTRVGDQEITPNLNTLLNDSVYFKNYFAHVDQGNTADAEFSTLNSLYPLPGIVAFIEYAQNTYAALPRFLAGHGYYTAVFHGDVPTFWNRANIYPGLGYQKYYMKGVFKPTRPIGFRNLGDKDFFDQSMQYIKTLPQPFFVTLITLTTHTPFIIPKDLQTLHIPSDTKLNTTQKNYLQSVHFSDAALGSFIQQLKQEGLYEKSLIVIIGDHGSYTYGGNALGVKEHVPGDLASQHVPLILLAPGTSLKGVITIPTTHLDIYPTIAHLLGYEPPRSVLGSDAFLSNDSRVALYRKRLTGQISTIETEKLEYHASSDGIFEHGSCKKVPEMTPMSLEECRSIFTTQSDAIRASDSVVRGNLINELLNPQVKQQ